MTDFNVSVSDSSSISIITIGEQGPPGSSAGTVDTGTRSSPVTISTAITPSSDGVNRIFVAGPSTNPTISHTAGNSRVILFSTSDVNTITIGAANSNFQLSGEWVGRNGSVLVLDWDGSSKYVEVSRNEI